MHLSTLFLRESRIIKEEIYKDVIHFRSKESVSDSSICEIDPPKKKKWKSTDEVELGEADSSAFEESSSDSEPIKIMGNRVYVNQNVWKKSEEEFVERIPPNINGTHAYKLRCPKGKNPMEEQKICVHGNATFHQLVQDSLEREGWLNVLEQWSVSILFALI